MKMLNSRKISRSGCVIVGFSILLGMTGVLSQDNSGDDHPLYTNKYDNIDIDAVIANERLLKNYIGCLLENNPCTPDGKELKSKFDGYFIFFLVKFETE